MFELILGAINYIYKQRCCGYHVFSAADRAGIGRMTVGTVCCIVVSLHGMLVAVKEVH